MSLLRETIHTVEFPLKLGELLTLFFLSKIDSDGQRSQRLADTTTEKPQCASRHYNSLLRVHQALLCAHVGKGLSQHYQGTHGFNSTRVDAAEAKKQCKDSEGCSTGHHLCIHRLIHIIPPKCTQICIKRCFLSHKTGKT